MKKLLVYPFTYETLPLARYCESLTDYCEVIPVVEKGSGISGGNDVAYLDGGTATGLVTTSDFEEAVKTADDILFTGEILDAALFMKYFAIAKGSGKKILVSGDFSKHKEVDLESVQVLSRSVYEAEVNHENRLSKIPVPIILVTGQGSLCQKFNIQIGLRRKFQQSGYDVSQVGSKQYSSLFGIHAMPHFSDTPLWKKIMLYNQYFKDIVDNESPDVLIVGVPGGIMPIDDWHNELFGETAIAISKSLSPDISIISTFLTKIEQEFLDEMKDYFKYALGAPLDYVHLSNIKQVFEPDLRTINYMITDSKHVFEEQEITSDTFFNVFSNTSNTVYDKIILQLQSNIEVL